LMATAPNRVWSWDITKLKGPYRGSYFCLYTIIDIYSRYTVGWMIAASENKELAEQFLSSTITKYPVEQGQLTIHSDRGSPMIAHNVAQMLSNMGVTAFAAEQGLDERTITALHDVAMAGRVRCSRYQHREALSLQQAQRDLRDLTAADILQPVGRTRARYYTAGHPFPPDALDTAQTPMTLTHPYRD
ncbi:DDE-type integrase/transposase/recombinase, partial [Streptomyces sp. NPDC048419]|uniref:DDE-type integrase/transposase/recombinase n=1 Tax=Streptomyces sp. NPDC048419 TaxID=3365547 RepID=UPI0037140699